MKLSGTERSYRRSAMEGASPIGLMIALFDTLVGDLRRAASALRKNDIETRCRELNHATLVLGQLNEWVDLENGGESAQTLYRFYAYLRAKMMAAAVTQSAKLLETQIDMILHVRSAWQKLEVGPMETAGPGENAAQQLSEPSASTPEVKVERLPCSNRTDLTISKERQAGRRPSAPSLSSVSARLESIAAASDGDDTNPRQPSKTSNINYNG